MGADIIRMQNEHGWGNSIIKQLSLDLRAEFPSVNGFSVRNLEYMKRWYSFYYEHVIKSQQPVAIFRDTKSHQSGAILMMPKEFAMVPWGQHVYIVYNCQTLDEALFYINKTITENLSRANLQNYIDAKLYQITWARQSQHI